MNRPTRLRPTWLRPALAVLTATGLGIAVLPLGQGAYGLWSQHQLREQWAEPDPSPRAPEATSAKRSPVRLVDPDGPAQPGAAAPPTTPWPHTRILIPDLNLDDVVLADDSPESLHCGPGHDPNTNAPGTGNCVIVGHRNVYGSFFLNLDQLMLGEPIELRTHHHSYIYRVRAIGSTPETNLGVLDLPPAGQPAQLTLISCTLPHTDNRLVVQASFHPEETTLPTPDPTAP